ncbi:hypothetical protein F1C76_21435 [Geodermatophilaceae bacterium NBWT11]|nr:hypothetical protein F1C76_21435 [Geodermatophilaceae bacterium NBWT11]
MTAHHAVARPLTWVTGMLLTTATALGLWFGVGAPDVSPVAAPAVQAAQAAQADAGQQATGGDAPRGAGPQGGGAGQGGRGGGRR